jgi:predicted small lipoprotein YifL
VRWLTALVLLVSLVAAGLSGPMHAPASAAEPPNLTQCGVIGSVQPPTSSTAASIAIGTRNFAIDMSVQPSSLGAILVGEARCVSGPMLQTQIFLALTVGPVPESVCGIIRVAVAPTTAPGGLTIGSDPELVLKMPVGTTLPTLQGSNQCVSVSVDAVGDAIYAGLRSGLLPNTSTLAEPNTLGWIIGASAGVALLGILLVFVLLRILPVPEANPRLELAESPSPLGNSGDHRSEGRPRSD